MVALDAGRDGGCDGVRGCTERLCGRTVASGHLALGWDAEPCAKRPEERCRVYTSFVFINTAAGLSEQERVMTFAHEIGHALGLNHARRCNGGTIMYDDLVCASPARAIGVDDIATLNQRFNEGRPVTAVPATFDALTAGAESGVFVEKNEAAVSALTAADVSAIADRLRAGGAARGGKAALTSGAMTSRALSSGDVTVVTR